MNRLIVTTILTIVFYFNVLGQQKSINIHDIHLVITGRVFDSSIPYDIDKGFPIKIYIISNNDIRIYDSESGQIYLALEYGIDYKIIFSKTGYESKLLLVEVKGSKKPDEFNYEIPIEINLISGMEDERILKPTMKIFYNPKKDYYEGKKL